MTEMQIREMCEEFESLQYEEGVNMGNVERFFLARGVPVIRGAIEGAGHCVPDGFCVAVLCTGVSADREYIPLDIVYCGRAYHYYVHCSYSPFTRPERAKA